MTLFICSKVINIIRFQFIFPQFLGVFKKLEATVFFSERLVPPTLANNITSAFSGTVMSTNHCSLKMPLAIRYLSWH